MPRDLKTSSEEKTPAENDITFECPMCGKSMVIEAEGAGEIVVCPSCDQEVIVPGGPLWDEVTAQIESGLDVASEAPAAIEETHQREKEHSLDELKRLEHTIENQLKENRSQRTSTAEAIAQALNQATRFKLALQRLEERQRLLESQLGETRDKISALERML